MMHYVRFQYAFFRTFPSRQEIDFIFWNEMKITKMNEFTRILIISLVNSKFAHFCNFHLISKYRVDLQFCTMFIGYEKMIVNALK